MVFPLIVVKKFDVLQPLLAYEHLISCSMFYVCCPCVARLSQHVTQGQALRVPGGLRLPDFKTIGT